MATINIARDKGMQFAQGFFPENCMHPFLPAIPHVPRRRRPLMRKDLAAHHSSRAAPGSRARFQERQENKNPQYYRRIWRLQDVLPRVENRRRLIIDYASRMWFDLEIETYRRVLSLCDSNGKVGKESARH